MSGANNWYAPCSLRVLVAVQMITGVAVHAQQPSPNSTLSRMTPLVALQQRQIAALAPNLGSCELSQKLASEIDQEAASLVQTLNGGSRLPLKTTGTRNADEVRFTSSLKAHEMRLRRLELRLNSLPPCAPTQENKPVRSTLAGKNMEIAAVAAQPQANKADETRKAGEDRNRPIKDAIKKMLDQIAEISRAAKL